MPFLVRKYYLYNIVPSAVTIPIMPQTKACSCHHKQLVLFNYIFPQSVAILTSCHFGRQTGLGNIMQSKKPHFTIHFLGKFFICKTYRSPFKWDNPIYSCPFPLFVFSSAFLTDVYWKPLRPSANETRMNDHAQLFSFDRKFDIHCHL